MVSGRAYFGLTTDIWSCGIILFAMVCGYLPFEDPNTKLLYKKIINSELQIPGHVSETGVNILTGILHKDPKTRMSIGQIRNHKFCQDAIRSFPVIRGIMVKEEHVPVDSNILSQLKCLDVDLEDARIMVEKNKHNRVTATYYLLKVKH